ncbi:DUF1501 domain-containing protein [Polystyrenella longa]|uniref:DUF1501 domain-containing protein n=1 Tax=Polystyrenella longa TaxID=2528007 RepID=UPI0018D24D00|nr:DUF1501 domain-containing protein [Polystyrenella longa]
MNSLNERRHFLKQASGRLGSIALAAILADETQAATGTQSTDPLAAIAPPLVPKAKRVTFLYMTGGVSHVDSFDPKPQLFENHGKNITVDNWQGKTGEFSAT